MKKYTWFIEITMLLSMLGCKDDLSINPLCSVKNLVTVKLHTMEKINSGYGISSEDTKSMESFVLQNVWVFQLKGEELLYKEKIAQNVQAGSSLLFKLLPETQCTLYFIGNILELDSDVEQVTDRKSLFELQCRSSLHTIYHNPYIAELTDIMVSDHGELLINGQEIDCCVFRRNTAQIDMDLTFNLPGYKLQEVTYHNSPKSHYYLCTVKNAPYTEIIDTVILPHTHNENHYQWYILPNRGGNNPNIQTVQERNRHNIPSESCGFIRIKARETGTNKTLNYDIYVGNDNLTNFDINENSRYHYCVTINQGEFIITEDPRVSLEEGAINLSNYERYANCYVCSCEDSYRFDATVMGNGSLYDGTSHYLSHNGETSHGMKPVEVVLAWESTADGAETTARNVIDGKPLLVNGFVEFQTGNVEGNAVIAVKDETGNIIWSWHIWVTNRNIHVTSPLGYMLHNLGATDETVNANGNIGLLYQWGRKDPFPSLKTDKTNNNQIGDGEISFGGMEPRNYSGYLNVLNSIRNPTLFYRYIVSSEVKYYDWFIPGCFKTEDTEELRLQQQESRLWGGNDKGTQKTLYDPCPYGWRIPSCDQQVITQAIETGYLRVDDGNNFYPSYRYRNHIGSFVTNNYTFYWTTQQEGQESILMYLPDHLSKYRLLGCTVRCIRDR